MPAAPHHRWKIHLRGYRIPKADHVTQGPYVCHTKESTMTFTKRKKALTLIGLIEGQEGRESWTLESRQEAPFAASMSHLGNCSRTVLYGPRQDKQPASTRPFWLNLLSCCCHLPTIWRERSKRLYDTSMEPRNQK